MHESAFGPKRRFKDVRSMSAPGCKAEMLQNMTNLTLVTQLRHKLD